ncbi:MAG: UDP-N-acetylglucosamine 2-epimerase [Lentimicrobiaceae bacterium]|nr:UDP-N-acetylglucosamine 2-epimerase [Lentimicrobiaceae bacterium]
METVLIFRQLSESEKGQLKQRLLDNDCLVVLKSPDMLPAGLPDAQVLSLPSGISVAAGQKLLNAILAFGDLTIEDSGIGKYFDMGNFPLWHYQRFRIFFMLRPLFVIKEAVEHYLQGSVRVVCYCHANEAEAVRDFGNRLEVVSSKAVRAKKNYRALLSYSIYFLLRVLISWILKPNLAGKKHVVVDRSARQRCRHVISLKQKSDNYNLSPLFDLAGNDFLIISETEPPKTTGNGRFRMSLHYFAGLGRRSQTIYGEYILFRGLLSRGLKQKRRLMLQELQQKIEVVGAMDFNSNERLIFHSFVKLMPSASFYITKYLAFARFFEIHQPDTISAIDENSPSTRCMLDAARRNGALSIGIQHGNIGDGQPAYLYTQLDYLNQVMADYTLVWGEYWRDFLISKGNYPTDSVVVTGQMRTDIIPKMLHKSEDYRKAFSQGKPLVVFASQPIPDMNLRRQAAFDVFTAFKNQPQATLVVKLHPAERDAKAYYAAIAKEAGCTNYRIVYKVDLYELIAACDLLITCYSTVGTEAVYFGKPLIILDHHQEDLLGYKAEGVAWQAIDAETLESVSAGVLSGELYPDAEACRLFIQKYASSIDGKATERVLSFIQGL